MQPCAFIALRFLPQAECEAAAPLSISPVPDITIRVLMLFKGLSASVALAWDSVQPSFGQGPGIWKDRIGVKLKMMDGRRYPYEKYLCVIELGGMEVH
jgi:hypothetical protein